jgi:hypothetical protein
MLLLLFAIALIAIQAIITAIIIAAYTALSLAITPTTNRKKEKPLRPI